MGFALYTARKMSLQTKINNYNLKMAQISNRKALLANKADQFTKSQKLIDAKQARNGANIKSQKTMNEAIKNIAQQVMAFSAKGMDNVMGMFAAAFGAGMSDGSDVKTEYLDAKETGNNIKDTFIDAKQNADKNNLETEIAIEQQQLDAEKARVETLSKQAEVELEAVRKAEDYAIEKSAPKYCT